jgi:hypothetical protein
LSSTESLSTITTTGSCTDPYYLYGSIPLHPIYENNLHSAFV